MAKITASHNNQENLGAIASLGVLMCMIVTIVGIKLWWFKQRLTFEPNRTQNETANGATPPVIVPRRNKQARYKRDKRYSQQIYDSVEVHGVFRKKDEDEVEVQSPKQLPPIRIKQLSGSTSSLVLPPPRSMRKDREQIHSTAFEDLEIATPTTPILATASSSDLTAIKGSDTKLNLTFEEFEKQFKFREINADIPETCHIKNVEVIEVPAPPLRLNRSSSALIKPEKSQSRYLKSSQSIAIPESHKIIDRRPTDFSRPTEDLTKIDDYEGAKLFETFGERRPSGYIRYEEVDRDLQEEQYERELNESLEAKEFDPFKNEPILQPYPETSILEALKHEINENPDFQTFKNWNFNFETNQIKHSENDLKECPRSLDSIPALEYKAIEPTEVTKDLRNIVQEFPNEHHTKEESVSQYRSVKERRPTKFIKDSPVEITTDFDTEIVSDIKSFEFKNSYPLKENKPSEVFKDCPYSEFQEMPIYEYQSVKDCEPNQFVANSLADPTLDLENSGAQNEELVPEFRSVKDRRPTKLVRHSLVGDTSDEEFVTEFRSVKNRRPTKFVKDFPANESADFENDGVQDEFRSVKYCRPTSFMGDSIPHSAHSNNSEDQNEESVPVSTNYKHEHTNDNELPPSLLESAKEFKSIKERRPVEFVKDVESSVEQNVEFSEFNKNSAEKTSPYLEASNRKTNIDQQSDSWPQFEEEFEMPKVNVNKFNHNDFQPQFSSEEAEEFDTLKPEKNSKGIEKLNQETPKGYINDWPEDLSENEIWQEDGYSQNRYYSQIRSLMTTETSHNNASYYSTQIKQLGVTFAPQTTVNAESHDTAIKQRRPTGFVKKEQYTVSYEEEVDSAKNNETKFFNPTSNVEITELHEVWNNGVVEEPTKIAVRFNESTDFNDEKDIWDDNIKQRRPTGYIKTLETLDFSDEEEQFETTKERRPTGLKVHISNKETCEYELENKNILLNPTVKFKEGEEYIFKNSEDNQDSLIKQRRPTSLLINEEIENMEKRVNFKLDDEDYKDENKQENEAIKQRRPTGHVKKRDLTFLENPPPIYQPSLKQHSPDLDDSLWLEMEKEVQQMNSPHIDEEFAKIRHSYEVNEADFLEQKSPFSSPQEPLGFGKSISDDWENFKKLKINQINQPLESPQEIQIIFGKEDVTTITTTSILKDAKIEEDIQVKPRKSKVTFDFKTEERLIPARNDLTQLGYNSDYDDDVYDKPPPPIPTPQPTQRLSKINYNNENSSLTPIVTIPSKISLFGSQISQEDNEAKEDSWLAIRKHRNLTEEFQNLSPHSLSPPPEFYTPPPKPSYRNPMAQLAIQRAKEARADMNGFKTRSINDRKPEASNRQRQKFVNLNYDDGSEA